MRKQPPTKKKEKKTFLLSKDVTEKLAATSARLEVPQSRILEVLVRKHADALQMRLE